MEPIPILRTGISMIDQAFRIAIGDITGNIMPFQDGLLTETRSCLMAGLHYNTPWTRDAAFNTWYAAGLLTPEVARNTLLSVLMRDEIGVRIGGQYWDAIIWVTGAWYFYLYTGDRSFLQIAFEATLNSLRYFEETEFDRADGLFRGGACFQDGVAGYPDMFADPPAYSGILEWVKRHPDKKAGIGYGLPMKALSTNCLYCHAYRLIGSMAKELQIAPDPRWESKAESLKRAINRMFFNPASSSYRYLVDANDSIDRQEGFGHAFAILFGVADAEQTRAILRNQRITQHGIPCVWPPYERYSSADGTSFGRHCGTIWPQVNAAWAEATAISNRHDLAWLELQSLAAKACRDSQFTEIYHPITGRKYGGMQERRGPDKIVEWKSCDRQTWCATGYIHMILSVLLGMRFSPEGIHLSPHIPAEARKIEIKDLRYRQANLHIAAETAGEPPPLLSINGIAQPRAFIPANLIGSQSIHLTVPQIPQT